MRDCTVLIELALLVVFDVAIGLDATSAAPEPVY